MLFHPKHTRIQVYHLSTPQNFTCFSLRTPYSVWCLSIRACPTACPESLVPCVKLHSSSSRFCLHCSRISAIMARTLPWLKNGTTTTLQPARSKPTKRQRMLDPNSDSDDNVNPRAVGIPRRSAAPASGELEQLLQSYIN